MREHAFRRLTVVAAFLVALAGWANASWALSLQEAKAQGLVGEQANGYLAAVKSDASADVKALVDDINVKRKEKYQSIAIAMGDAPVGSRTQITRPARTADDVTAPTMATTASDDAYCHIRL